MNALPILFDWLCGAVILAVGGCAALICGAAIYRLAKPLARTRRLTVAFVAACAAGLAVFGCSWTLIKSLSPPAIQPMPKADLAALDGRLWLLRRGTYDSNGDRLAYFDLDHGGVLTDVVLIGPEYPVRDAHVLPSGRQLVAVVAIVGGTQLVIVDFDTGQQTRLPVTNVYAPRLSPDGVVVAFLGDNGPSRKQIGWIDREGERLQVLKDWDVASFAWAPDSSSIIISALPPGSSPEHTRQGLYLLDPATQVVRELPAPRDDSSRLVPEFSPDGSILAYLCQDR